MAKREDAIQRDGVNGVESVGLVKPSSKSTQRQKRSWRRIWKAKCVVELVAAPSLGVVTGILVPEICYRSDTR